MLELIFNEQDFINCRPSDGATISEYPGIWPGNSAFYRLTDPLQSTPDIFHLSYIANENENALGLYGICGAESHCDSDLFASLSATSSASNQTDTQVLNTACPQHVSPSDNVSRFASRRPFVRGEETFTRVGDNLVTHSSQTITLPESYLALKPTARSSSMRVDASSLLSRTTPPRSLRHTPYPVGPDRARRSAPPASTHVYQCRWTDGAGPCDTDVSGTKNAIGHHLQSAHAIRVTADKTFQVCCWETCRKSMRRESIPRHILAVHMQEKVPCPGCGTHFARADSLQRHQRAQCPVGTEASDACRTRR